MNRLGTCLTTLLAPVALVACGADPATAPDKTGVSAASGTIAHDEEQPPPPPDGEYTNPDGSVYCVRNGLKIMAPCPVPPVVVAILSAAGRTAGGSFISRAGDNVIDLSAGTTGPAPLGPILWQVLDDPDDFVPSRPPDSVPDGPTVAAIVPAQDSNRFNAVPQHRPPLDRLALRFVVRASVLTASGRVFSEPVLVAQTERDALREEYVEYGIRLPNETWTVSSLAASSPFLFAQLNRGDYGIAVIAPYLADTLARLQSAFGSRLTVTSAFRDPFHYRVHLVPSGNQRRYAESVHQYGIAADLATSRDSVRWARLRDVARTQFQACSEPFPQSTVDHVHVDFRPRSICPREWR